MSRNQEFLHAAVGNINIDITIYLEKLPSPDEAIKARSFLMGKGGGALNYSVAASRFGHSSRLIGVTSKIFLGLGFLNELKEEGIDTKHIKVFEEGVPGFSTILNVEGEQRRLITFRGTNLLLSSEIASKGILAEPVPRIAHFSSVNPILFREAASKIKEKRKEILLSYDPGTETRGNEEKIKEVMDEADVVFLNESEAERLFGRNAEEEIKKASQNKEKIFILKKGARGGAAYFEGEIFSAQAPRINPVDTTGAGDAFDATFNGCYIETGDVGKCVGMAVVAGSLKSLKHGSSSSPYRREIEDYLERYITR
ncbi:MAG: carbohydrate kinase family protein [Fervidicoccaceae archaeon]|nr:MAG: hypothetical protein C0179_00950 [Fervidicoccus sp.]